ncbi:MAG: Stk1 family PASTA domain-containing Ser/Thr kinase [Eubacteriales bacterium]
MRGKLLGDRYELLEVIGYGGMALVYKAKDILLNRLVAVKILKSEFNENEQFIKKFQRESQSAASLSHNNIVNVFDVGVQDSLHYIVMEYVNGKTLKSYIQEKGRLHWQEAIFIAKQITFALDHAHRNNIIHRDIKPQNILLNEEMIPKVADFGIARAITSSTITLVEETMGSVHYISPEQARGGFVDAKSDLYSLGIIMYEMLTGKVPFDNDNTISIAIKHIQEDIKFPEDITDVPLGLIDIMYKLVKKNPLERYSNARELIKDLIQIQNDPNTRIEFIEPSPHGITKKTPIIKESQLKSADKNGKEKNSSDSQNKLKRMTIIILIIMSIVLGVSAFALQNFLSVKEVTVPDVKDMLYTDAIKMLDSKNLDYETEFENNDEIEKNHIIKQTPNGNTVVKEGHKVKLIVSDGPKQIEMPDVVDKYEVEGVSELENQGFIVKEIIREYNDEVEKNKIYLQSPLPGTKLVKGSEVKLYVSQGKDVIELPSFVGKSLTEVKQQLLALGLAIGEIEETTSDTYDKNIVISQDPKADKEVKKDSEVNLTVSKGLIKSKSISININSYVNYEEPKNVKVKVVLTNEENVPTTVYDKMHMSDETVEVTLKGVGTLSYQILIDDKVHETGTITF